MTVLNEQNIVIILEGIGFLISLSMLYLCVKLMIETDGKLKKSFRMMFIGVLVYNILKIVKILSYLYHILDQNILNILTPILGLITFLFLTISIFEENNLFKDLLNNKK